MPVIGCCTNNSPFSDAGGLFAKEYLRCVIIGAGANVVPLLA